MNLNHVHYYFSQSVASTQSTADDVAERHATNDEFDEEIDQSMNSSIDELSDDELNDI